MISRPDVLVLGSGGLLGEEWMNGVLAGIEDATGFDMRDCEQFLGTSAGSIIASGLASGRTPRRPDAPRTEIEPMRDAEANGLGAAALGLARRAGEWTLAAWAPLALAATGPGGRFVGGRADADPAPGADARRSANARGAVRRSIRRAPADHGRGPPERPAGPGAAKRRGQAAFQAGAIKQARPR